MTQCAPTTVPHKHGKCEWCGHHTIVYAYILWVCGVCLIAPYGRDELDTALLSKRQTED